MEFNKEKFLKYLFSKKLLSKFSFFIFAVLGGYAFAHVVTTLVTAGILEQVISDRFVASKGRRIGLKLIQDQPNFYKLKKQVLKRNIFNSDGKFPDEEEDDVFQSEDRPNSLAMDTSCTKSMLDLVLVGIIFVSNPSNSIAIVKEKKYKLTDIYHIGDVIEGQEDVFVVDITPTKLIMNNQGRKECLELDIHFTNEKKTKQKAEEKLNLDYVLPSSWVDEQVGPGGASIINAARVIPKKKGYEIFDIDRKGIFGKDKGIDLREGDIIVQVNDVSMQNAEQGHTLFQAFQDETEIRLKILRKDKIMNVYVKIK